jgi:alpha-2-macroglobulin
MQSRNRFTIITLYLLIVATIFSLAVTRMRAQERMHAQEEDASPHPQSAPESPEHLTASPLPKPAASPSPLSPRFMLSTNRAYGSDEVARVWLRYQDISALNFRVYQVNDPMEFFRRLPDLHRMGGEEFEEMERVIKKAERSFSFLALLHEFRAVVYKRVRRYVRSQLRRHSRTVFNDKYRAGDQLPIDKADYARMPSLESNDLTLRGSWRQTLPPQSGFDSQTIPFGKREPGVYLIEAVHLGNPSELRAYAVSVVTDMTMISKTAPGEMLVYLADRKSGMPYAEASVEIVRDKEPINRGKTNRDGVIKIQLPAEETSSASDPAGNMVVMAEHKEQFAISDFGLLRFLCGAAGEGTEANNLKGYVYTDRPVYRPKDKVYFKGIVRKPGKSTYELTSERAVTITITDDKGRNFFEQKLALSANGTFYGELNLPSRLSLGTCTISAKIGAGRVWADFKVDEYRKPDFKIRVTTPKQYVLAGEKTTFKVEAQYFSALSRDSRGMSGGNATGNAKAFYLYGAPVANAHVSYDIYRAPYQHSLEENLDDTALIGDRWDDDEVGDNNDGGYRDVVIQNGKTRLDTRGQVEIPFEVPQDAADFRYHIVVEVTTKGAYREMTAQTNLVATRSKIAVAATAEKKIIYQGEQAKIIVKTADYEGRPVSTKVRLKFIGRKWERTETTSADKPRRFEVEQFERELGTGEITTDAQGDAVFSWHPPATGVIKIIALLGVDGGEVSVPGGELWVADRTNQWADFAAPTAGAIRLVPDKASYKPGETAHVQALLPTSNAHLLVTTELRSIINVWRVDAPQGVVMIDVPIDQRYAPNVYLSVCYVKEGEIYTADKVLAVPASDKFLNIEIFPNKQMYKPRDPATYDIFVKNADGSPAAGVEISLGIVDEAVYSISPETIGNIRREFYGYQYKCVDTHYSTHFTFTGYSDERLFELAQNKPSYQLAMFKNETGLAEAKIRKDFRDTAFWQPNIITDHEGKQTVKLILPDNQTIWRATARAVTADLRLGSKVTRVVSRNHIMINLETPPFATEGDTITVSGIVHNYYSQGETAQVELMATGATLLDPARRTIDLPKNGTQRINWRVTAARGGTATLRAMVRAKEVADGIQVLLPIALSGSPQTKGKALMLGEESSEGTLALNLPASANMQSRTLRIDLAPSLTAVINGALASLTGRPQEEREEPLPRFADRAYQSTEQAMSALLAQTAFQRNYGVRGYLPRLDLDHLQRKDGGWGWGKADKTDPFMTAYVVAGLARTGSRPYYLDSQHPDTSARGRKKLEEILDAGRNEGLPVDLESQAYLLYAYVARGEGVPRSVPPIPYAARPSVPPTRLTRPSERQTYVPYVQSPDDRSTSYVPRPLAVQPADATQPLSPVTPRPRPPVEDPGTFIPAPRQNEPPTALVPTNENRVYLLREKYAAAIQAARNADGSYDFSGERQPTPNQLQLLYSLTELLDSLSTLRQFETRNAALHVRDKLQAVQSLWLRVSVAAEAAPALVDLKQEMEEVQKQIQNQVDEALSPFIPYRPQPDMRPRRVQPLIPRPAGQASATDPPRLGATTDGTTPHTRPTPRPVPSGIKPDTGGDSNNLQLVKVSTVLAEHSADGTLRISITGQTPSSGWKLTPEYVIEGSILNIKLRGAPPQGLSNHVISYPTTMVTLKDPLREIQRVIVRGETSARSTTPISRGGGGTGSNTSNNGSGAVVSAAGQRIADKQDALVEDFARSMRALRNPDGVYIFENARDGGTPEAQLLYAWDRLTESARVFRGALTPDVKRRSIRELVNTQAQVNRLLPHVRIAVEFTQRWQGIQTEISQLTKATLGTTPNTDNSEGLERGQRPTARLPEPLVRPPQSLTPVVPRPATRASDPKPLVRPPQSPTPELPFAREVEQIRRDFGASLGLRFNQLDRSYEPTGTRQPTADEWQALDRLAALAKSFRQMDFDRSKSAALKCREDMRAVEQVWARLSTSPKLNKDVRSMLEAVRRETSFQMRSESPSYSRQQQLNLSRQQRYINELFAKRNDLKSYGKALLALTLERVGEQLRANQVINELERQARVTASDAHWESVRNPLPERPEVAENCSLEATAFAIRALAKLKPQSHLLPKAVRWLLAARHNGAYWETTLHTAFAVLALSDYLEAVPEPLPAYTIAVYLNGEQVFSQFVTGFDAANGQALFIERKDGAVRNTNQIRIVKHGRGSLYVSATLDYLAREEQTAAQSSPGLQLTRDYLRLRVSEAKGKPQWTIESFTGDPQPGDLLVSRLRVRGTPQRYLMIEDPIPAGCELAAPLSGMTLNDAAHGWREGEEEGDSGTEIKAPRKFAFQQFFPGEATFQHILRVQLPGEFKVAPARARLVYQPAIQATTESRKLRIVDGK